MVLSALVAPFLAVRPPHPKDVATSLERPQANYPATSLDRRSTDQTWPMGQWHSYSRLVYNRVPKTGSTTMIKLTQKLGHRNNFNVVVDSKYYPNSSQLEEIITNLPERTLYINHCNTWLDAPPDVGFFNMVRQPYEHDESFFYYAVDPEARPMESVEKEMAKQQKDVQCGCYKVEYDHCIRLRKTNNCSLTFENAHRRQFCDAPAKWINPAKNIPKSDTKFWCDPLQSLRSRYLFVGLTEQYARSVATLERLLPDWFAGASEVLADMPQAKTTSEKNKLTGTVRAPPPRPARA